mgnify:FL=1
MAVPTSGVLTMEGLAQEVLYGTYGSGNVISPIHMYDLINGGNSAGSGNSYPAINTSCTPNPHTRTSLQLPYVGCEGCLTINVYYATSIGDASNLTTGSVLYTDPALTTPLSNGSPSFGSCRQDGFTNTIPSNQRKCSSGCFFDFDVNSSGVIQSGFSCGCP